MTAELGLSRERMSDAVAFRARAWVAALVRVWLSSASAASAAFLFRVEGGVVNDSGKDADGEWRGCISVL